MLVKLTEKGRSEEEPGDLDFGGLFDCLSDEEQRIFGEYLDRIITALTEKIGYDDEDEYERMMAAREHFADLMDGHADRRGLFGLLGGFARFAQGERDPRNGPGFDRFDRAGRGDRNERD